jgi:pimeloyl-ACP methyl ester carboxylesterase
MPEIHAVAKASKSIPRAAAVRTRRAYFDCRFGQLHVRTAFPTTGGFDEQVTLFCLHANGASSRTFGKIMPELADVRSVYAPDLPGCGESDPSPTGGSTEAAAAVSDLASDLRLRQIDVFGVQFGASVAMELAVARPELVRRLALAGIAADERWPAVKHKRWAFDLAGFGADALDVADPALASQLAAFLKAG